MNAAQPQAVSPLAMTDLEQRLAGADGLAQGEAIQHRLSTMEAHLAGRIAGGLPRSEFAAWQHALAAVVAARAVVHHVSPASSGTTPSTVEGLFRRTSP